MSGSTFRACRDTDHPLTVSPAIMPFCVAVGDRPVIEHFPSGSTHYMTYRSRNAAEQGAYRARVGGIDGATVVDRREKAK